MELNLKDYHFHLPEHRIAKFPLEDRSASQLLVCRDSKIEHHSFSSIGDLLPSDSHLVLNDTKVIPARIQFFKSSGARIEVFLLEPESPKTTEEAMASKKDCTWRCLIGNAKRWKIGQPETVQLPDESIVLTRASKDLVNFEWYSEKPFSSIISDIGKIPLPPYIKRELEEEDKTRYQTVFSRVEGAVAAPTAGLHFTASI